MTIDAMTLTPEEREAVDRLREATDYPCPSAHGPLCVVAVSDLKSVLDSLRARPATTGEDGEPVTEQWLERVGIVQTGVTCDGKPVALRSVNVNASMSLICGTHDGNREWYFRMWWMQGVGRVSRWFPLPLQPKTRADVRRLCAALGIQLPTPGGPTDANK